jgi:acetyl esterase/lipase
MSFIPVSLLRQLARCLAFAVLGASSAWAQPSAESKARVDLFFDDPALVQASLSPNGQWLARLVSPGNGGAMQLIIGDVEGKSTPKVVAQFSRARIDEYRWVNDDMLIASVYENLRRGAVRRAPGLVSIRRDGEHIRTLIKTDWDVEYTSAGIPPLEPNHRFLALGAAGTDDIIVGEELRLDNDWRVLRAVRPLVVNTRTGARRSLLESEPSGATAWTFDHLGRARMAFSYSEGKVTGHWMDLSKREWRVLYTHDTLSRPFRPLAVVGDDKLYVTTELPDGGGDEVRLLDFATGKPSADVVVSTPGFSDSLAPILDRRSGALRGWRARVDAVSDIWTRPEEAALQAKVDAMLKGRVNLLLCWTNCDTQDAVLVYSYSDREPGDYVIYSPKVNQWQRVGSKRPKIDPRQMGTLEFHRIKARDGLEFPVWVTRPAGERSKPRAAVVLVHGGPWARGAEWEWNAESQFLASLGYVVIEPEFRGSTGYGDKLFRAGFRQWGQAMQDDVTDSLRFAVSKGYVDPARVCIAGASYGGYATLMGLAKDPDQYRCGVAWVGVTDPELMITAFWSDVSPEGRTFGYKRMVGDPETDKAMFDANSPLKQVARIKAPLLLAYGGLDRRVPIEHGERFRAALRGQGRDPEWVVYDDDFHGWYHLENRRDFYARFEAFLAKHLKP